MKKLMKIFIIFGFFVVMGETAVVAQNAEQLEMMKKFQQQQLEMMKQQQLMMKQQDHCHSIISLRRISSSKSVAVGSQDKSSQAKYQAFSFSLYLTHMNTSSQTPDSPPTKSYWTDYLN